MISEAIQKILTELKEKHKGEFFLDKGERIRHKTLKLKCNCANHNGMVVQACPLAVKCIDLGHMPSTNNDFDGLIELSKEEKESIMAAADFKFQTPAVQKEIRKQLEELCHAT